MVGKAGRRGWGRIRQLPSSKRYQASYVAPDLTRHNAPSTFTSKLDAEYWLADERRRIERDEWSPPAQRAAEKNNRGITLGEYGPTWIAQRTTRSGQPLKARTRAHYEDIFKKHIEPTFGKVPLKHITKETVRTWYARTLTDKPVMRSHTYGLLHALLASAVADEHIGANPAVVKNAMRAERTREPIILSVDEVAQLADNIDPRFRAFILISAWLGTRYGETIELRRKDCSKDLLTITVARGATHRKGCRVDTPKSGRGRTVAVPPHIRPDLQHHLKTYVVKNPDALLFQPARGGCHLNDKVFREYFTTALKTIDREGVRTHDLRHFSGTQVARVGNLIETMTHLGHSTVGASLRYQHMVSGRDAAIAEGLSKLATEKQQ